MLDLSKITPVTDDGYYNTVIEIPKGEHVKYELDKESNTLQASQILPEKLAYPENYGFIPSTLAQDGDPVDVFVLGPKLKALTIVKVKPIGLLLTEDDSGVDNKVIALPVNMKEPFSTVPKYIKLELESFLTNKKKLNPKKWIKIQGWQEDQQAQAEITEAIKNF